MRAEIEPEWINYKQAQRISGLGRTTIWKLISTGEIEAAKVGKAIRINRVSLTEFMGRHATQPTLPGFDDAGR